MVFIHDIDNNILNYGTRFSRVYQEESEIWELYQEIIVFGLEPNKKMAKRRCTFLRQYFDFYNIPLHFWKGTECSGIIKNQNIYGGICTTKWMLYSYVLWCLLLPLCTVSSGTSHNVSGRNWHLEAIRIWT